MLPRLSKDVFPETMAQCFGYWNGLRAGRCAPTLLALDPFFSETLTDRAVATDVSGSEDSYMIWAVGSQLLPFISQPRPGCTFLDLHGEIEASKIWQTFAAVKDLATPHIAAFDYVGSAPGIRSTRELYLPFRTPDSSHIGDVLTVIDFSSAPVPHDQLGPGQRLALSVTVQQKPSIMI